VIPVPVNADAVLLALAMSIPFVLTGDPPIPLDDYTPRFRMGTPIWEADDEQQKGGK
jgi:hypothetical protein